jgi:signal transduction histidine kinase
VEALLRKDIQWQALLLTASLTPTLLWRRSHPLLMVAIVFSVSAIVPFFNGNVPPTTYTIVFILLLPFSLFRWGSGREVTLGAALILAKLALSAAVGQESVPDSFGGLAVLSAVATGGLALRFRAGARWRELEQVRSRERETLARDLHDTVAHHVSAMAIRAQAGLAVGAQRPEAAMDALRLIEAEASRALAEMRTMVRALRRDEPADFAPGPIAGDLLGLSSEDGTPVSVTITGALESVPAPLGTALFRMARESVTNARRHAKHATRIDIHVEIEDTKAKMRIIDDGQPQNKPSSGYGLRGMRERAQLLGGSFDAGPDAGSGGWRVLVELPLTGSLP